jgi:hypothetical protein
VFLRNDGFAEQIFREAFERLKNNNPEVLSKDAPVTQANVAREARRNPCSLLKSRYPALVRDIQRWIEGAGEASAPAPQKSTDMSGRRNLELVTIQRDLALSMLAEADARALQLTRELDRLQASAQTSNFGMNRQQAA